MTNNSSNSRAAQHIWLAALILLGIFGWLALHWPHNGFWYDEALTTWVATDSWQSLLRWCTQVDIQVPFHYIVLRLWATVAGNSEFSLRLLSVFCVLLAVAGTMSVGRRLARNNSVGYVAALIFGTLPGIIWLGFEVRAYALALALYAWATAFLISLLDPATPTTKRRWLLVGYAVLMVATLYTHYTAIAGFAAHLAIVGVLVVTSRSRRLLQTLIAMVVLVGIGFAPWLPTMLTRGVADRSYYVGSPITPDRAIEVMLGFKLLGREDAPQVILPLVIGYGALIVAGLLFAFRKRQWTAALVGGFIALTPVAITTLLVYFKPKLAGRYVWPAWLGFDLLISFLLLAISRWARLLAVICLAALIVIPWLSGEIGQPPQSDFRAAYNYICTHGDPRDVIALRDGTLFVVQAYYGRRAPCDSERERVSIALPAADMTNVEQALTYPVALTTINEAINRQSPPSIWVVAWQGDVMDPQALSYGVLDTLGDHTVIGRMFGDVRIDRYENLNAAASDPASGGQVFNIAPVPGGPILNRVRVFAPDVVHAGDVIIVQAWWSRGKALEPDLRVSPRITTLDGGWTYTQVDQPPSSWKYVDDRWRTGEPVLGRYELNVGPDVPTGKFAIRYTLYDARGRWEPIVLTVGEINVER